MTNANTARSTQQDQETKPTKSEQTQRHTTKSKTIQQHQGQRPRSRTNDKHEYKARTMIQQNRTSNTNNCKRPKTTSNPMSKNTDNEDPK